MKRLTSCIIAVGLATGMLAGTTYGGLIGYDDEDAWRADAGDWALETFEGFGDLTELTDLPGLGVEFGLLNDGVHFPHVMSVSTTGGTSRSGDKVLVNRDIPELPGLGPIILLPQVDGTWFTAAGYWNTGGDDSTEMRFYDEQGDLIGSRNTGVSDLVFNGLVSSTPVFRIEIDTGGIGNEYITIDDLQVTVTPAPGALALLGLCGLAAPRRRRR